MNYRGDYRQGGTVYFTWDTPTSDDGESVTRDTDGTVSIYKDDGTTEVTTGITDTEDFDSLTGIHHCKIVLTNSWYAREHDYSIVLSAAVIDGVTVNKTIASFSIENRFMQGSRYDFP